MRRPWGSLTLGRFDLAGERVDALLGSSLLGLQVVQRVVGRLQFALGFRYLFVQRFDLLAQGIGIQQLQVVQVLLLAAAFFVQRVPLGLNLSASVGEGGIRQGGFHFSQLSLKILLLQLQLGQRVGDFLQLLALRLVHVDQGLQRGDVLSQRLPLGCGFGALLGQLFDGGPDLGFGFVKAFFGFIQLLHGLALGSGELALAVGQLGLGVVQLLLHIGQFFVHVLEYGGIEHVDAALLYGDVDALLDDAGGLRRRDAVEGLEGRHQLVLHIVGKGQYVHVVPGDGEYGYGQHVRVQLHGHRRADVVAPVAPQLVQPGGDLDQRGVHVRPVVELHDDHGDVVPGRRGDLFYVVQRGEGGLHGPGQLVLHLLRRGAHVAGVHHHVGQIHAGQKVGGHMLERYDPQHDHQYDAHNDRVWLFDAVP